LNAISNAEAIHRYANARPFLRWAGSKRRLLKHLIPYVPAQWNRYYEPFLGGGSLFFFLAPSHAHISDASAPLIATYRGVKRNPNGILSYLRPLRPSKSSFDQIRSQAPENETEAAAQFIFLNKACWNGLYRVNSKGIFNVPYGWPRSDFLIDEPNFLKCAKQLQRRSIRIQHQDFEAISDSVTANDFVFLDPPYITSHNMNGFADWNESLFRWQDQIRLAEMAHRLVFKGANVLITNAAHADIRALYPGFGHATYERTSTLAGDLKFRKTTSEAIIYGGPSYVQLKVRAPNSQRYRHGYTKHRSS
jgi:DNA adenine methylase